MNFENIQKFFSKLFALILVLSLTFLPLVLSSSSAASSTSSSSSSSSPSSSSSWLPHSANETDQSNDVIPENPDESADPVLKLSKIFGFEDVPIKKNNDSRGASRAPAADRLRHRSPPEYMLELYKNVAYQDGVSKTPNPFQADVVRGMPDRALRSQQKYFFNVSNLKENHEQLIEAELHLFKLKPTLSSTRRSRSVRLFDIKLYQILKENADETKPQHLALLDHKRLPISFKPNWEVFKVGKAVKQWLSEPSSNHGLYIVATTPEGGLLKGDVIRFAQRLQNHDSKQPVLIVFSDQGQTQLDHMGSDLLDDLNYDPPAPSDSDLKSMRQNYIRFLNEEYRATHKFSKYTGDIEEGEDDYHHPYEEEVHKWTKRKKQQHFMSPQLHEKLTSSNSEDTRSRERRSAADFETTASTRREKKLSIASKLFQFKNDCKNNRDGTNATAECSYKKLKRATKSQLVQLDRPKNRPKKLRNNNRLTRRNLLQSRGRRRYCQRHDMYVDFKTIGWSDWIISPQGYNAYQCKGSCPFPLGQNFRPTNHATVQSIVHVLRVSQDQSKTNRVSAGAPCCVPSKLYSISLLYFDESENVVLKQYDEMVAGSCGCH